MRTFLMPAATVAALLVAGSASAGPLVVSPTSSANTLANALLAGSSGIALNSATLSQNSANMAGTFTGGTGILAFESGIVLTTGLATNIVGPNNQGSASGSGTSSSLTLKFTPNGNQISFAYQFGSEEYNEYVGSQYNDNFQFFVNGVNYALIPGTSTQVAINNVNCLSNSSYYISNSNSGGCGNAGLNTQLDGLTTLLSFIAPVNVGVENTLQLTISDIGDSVLDSAVMIKANSLQVCGGPGQPPCGVPDLPSTMLLLGSGLAATAFARRFFH